LETAHPIKFFCVEPALNVKLPIPEQIESVINKEKISIKIKSYEGLKTFFKVGFFVLNITTEIKKVF
jgi:threonine synthase